MNKYAQEEHCPFKGSWDIGWFDFLFQMSKQFSFSGDSYS